MNDVNEQSTQNSEEDAVNAGKFADSKKAEEVNAEAAGPSQLEQLQLEVTEWKNKFYYLAAEQENVRRRVDKEKESLLKYGSEKIMRDLLEVVDNFERIAGALDLGQDADPAIVIKNFKIGVDMVMAQFLETLKKNGCEQIKALNQKFDPNFHEAMQEKEVEGIEPEVIVEEFMKGYVLNGRLLRPSKVVIAKK
jgi:molecular chaperone GrpE